MKPLKLCNIYLEEKIWLFILGDHFMPLSYMDLCYIQGMVDAGEVVTATVKREFGEEAMNSIQMSPEEKKRMEKELDELFATGREVV